MSKTPCLECMARSPTCHTTCERYAAYKARLAAIAEKKAADRVGVEVEIRRKNRTRKILSNLK